MTEPLVINIPAIPADAVHRIYQDFRVALPAAALSFQRDTSRVTASPRIAWRLYNGKTFLEKDVPSVPVLLPAGGGYCIAFDLEDDDPLMLLACDGPVAEYYATGDHTQPGSGVTSHTFGCAVAFPGGRISSPTSPTPPPNQAGEALMGAADGTSGVRLRRARPLAVPPEFGTTIVEAAGPTASLLLGGANAADPVACANEVLANLLALNTAIQSTPSTPGPWAADLVAIKAAFAAWALALQPMADLKARVEGPVPLP